MQHKLESQLFRAQTRQQALEERQQNEGDQSRETIRVLRQQLHQLEQDSLQQQQTLEQQLTEYRLKFEYAQRQLNATSG